ncbi:YhdP family protein [Sulfurospirillum oryzae]|uniref:YhdP family protein n=1 Tax=Sulfurospirillum oryzae TaxID=2976535 RepID=UPI0021E8EC24|nr:AsmA-like C-terminal domain-containing protein [Sulfurospirillum oryzae]
MIIKATSHTIRNIWILLLFIVLSVVALIGTLVNGISIDNLTLPTIKIDQLYIKLDKKLIVNIQTLEIKKDTQNDTSLEESTTIIKNFPYLNQFFSHIVIQNMIYNNETFKLDYEGETFKLESNHLNVNLIITPFDKWSLDLEIQEAYLKDYALHVKGKTHIDLKAKTYSFEGEFETFGLKGIAIFDLKDKLLTYHLQSETFTNKELTDLMNFIVTQVELDPIAKDWIDKNIVGQEYILHYFEGQFNIETFDYFPLKMHGQATVKDAIVSFEPSVPPAHVNEIGIEFKNDTLLFDVREPTYEKKTVDKADVYIYNLIGKGTGIVVDLTATSKLDEPIHKILHAFKIDVPITQTSGKTDAKVRLDIRFLPFDINATGKFKLSPSEFTLSGVPMSTKAGEVRLDNFAITLDHANLRYKNLFDINATGIFDAKKSRFDGFIDINSLLLDFSGTKLLKIANLVDQNASFAIENTTTKMLLPNLDTAIIFEKDNNQFIVNDLSKIASYSPFMKDASLTQGAVTVLTKDFENFDAKINLQNVTTPLLDNREPVRDFEIALTTNTQTLDASTTNNKLSIHFDKDITLHVKDLNISIPQGDDPLDIPIKTTIFGENSSLIDMDNNRTVLSERYTLTLYKDRAHLNSKRGQSSFEYEEKKGSYGIQASALDAEAANALLNRHYFYQGDFSLSIEGKDSHTMQGTFIMRKTFIKDLKFFNNLMATINAIPSLLVFNDPNFNTEGYFVDNGYVEFNQTKEAMHIKEVQLRGKSADIMGAGMVNLTNSTLDLKLQIKTLKTFSSAIDMIPLVGGIILGEDKRIATNVDVIGSTTDPKIETHLIMDTLKTPVNIIKRTLELPLELFK